ncbi:sensor histidine kinase [Undibacterium sp.]|uniref:sensor histidine kinase n=1 Tax=Undibacterium sp. TaxID=1914977 RepID=UPI00374D4C5D
MQAPAQHSAQQVTPAGWGGWPRSLFARLILILLAGLVLAHGFSFVLIVQERTQAATKMMIGYMEQDVSSSVALLDRLPASERSLWLPRLERRTYGFILGPGTTGVAPDEMLSTQVAAAMEDAIGTRYKLSANALPGENEHLQVHLQLSDGSPLTIDVRPRRMPVSAGLLAALCAEMLALALLSWLAVKQATRPLQQLASAADSLGPDLAPTRLPEDGPTEVARAATAFNAMQDRIAKYMTERMQILASISHDLQTPITRMRLRADLMDDTEHRATLQRNLKEMEALVREGVSYARTLQGSSEQPRKLDLDALLDSLMLDYVDAGEKVSLEGKIGTPLLTRPLALRRILTNLIDNAIKFSGSAELSVTGIQQGRISISVLDRGEGIPADRLEAVFQPFYRLESSRNRSTGGTGLGLAIARQLAQAMDAELTLHNREGGGLEARLTLAA